MPTKAFPYTDFTDFPLSISQNIAFLTNSSKRPPNTLPRLLSILLRYEHNILKVYKALLKVDRKVSVLSKACHRQALPIFDQMSTARVDSRKQVISNINETESSMLLASSSNSKDSLEVLSNNATSSTLLAAAASVTL
jgi:hypothetical protein